MAANKNQNQQLCDAAYKKDFEGVQQALAGGANPNATDDPKKGGATALWYAAIEGRGDIVKLLLEKGANVNFKISDGDTALHGAASGGHVDVCRILVEAGAKVGSKDKKGNTPASLAQASGWPAAALYLTSGWLEDNRKAQFDAIHVLSVIKSEYVPKKDKVLVVNVIHARSLTALDSNGLSDPYLTIHYMGHTHKTKVIHKTLNPDWNERYEFELKSDKDLDLPFKFEVWDKDLLSSSFEGGHEFVFSEQPLFLHRIGTSGDTHKVQINLNPKPGESGSSGTKTRVVTGHVLFEFAYHDAGLKEAREKKEAAAKAKIETESVSWENTQNEHKTKYTATTGVGRREKITKNFYSWLSEYVYSRDIIHFVKPGDHILAPTTAWGDSQLFQLIWNNGIVSSVDKEDRMVYWKRDPRYELVQDCDKISSTDAQWIRLVDTQSKFEDLEVGDVLGVRPEGYTHGSNKYTLYNDQWVMGEILEKTHTSMKIKYVQSNVTDDGGKKKEVYGDKTVTVVVDNDKDFELYVTPVVHPVTLEKRPVHPVFHTVASSEQEYETLLELKAWINKDKSLLDVTSDGAYQDTLLVSAVYHGLVKHTHFLLSQGVKPSSLALARTTDVPDEKQREKIVDLFVAHGGVITPDLVNAAFDVYGDEQKTFAFFLVRHPGVFINDDGIKKARYPLLLGDRRKKFHDAVYEKITAKVHFSEIKLFIDEDYLPLITEEVAETQGYSVKSLYPHLVVGLLAHDRADIADYLVTSKGASIRSAFSSAMYWTHLPTVKLFVEKYKLDVNALYPFREGEEKYPLDIIQNAPHSFEKVEFPHLKVETTEQQVGVYLLEQGAQVNKISGGIYRIKSAWKGYENCKELDLLYPVKNPLEDIKDPLLIAHPGDTIDMLPFLPKGVKDAHTLTPYTYEIAVKKEKGGIDNRTQMVVVLTRVEYLGRQHFHSIGFRIIHGAKDDKLVKPDHVALVAGPVSYSTAAKNLEDVQALEHMAIIRVAWTDATGEKKSQKIKLVRAETLYVHLDKTDKRKLWDPLCVDVGQEYYKSWDVPRMLSADEVAKKRDAFAAFVAKRKPY